MHEFIIGLLAGLFIALAAIEATQPSKADKLLLAEFRACPPAITNDKH